MVPNHDSKLAYIAYPIDLVSERAGELSGLVDRITKVVRSHVDALYIPGDAFKVRKDARTGPALGMINRHALDMADLVVAVLPQGFPTYGVPLEIENSVRQGKLTILITDTDTWMMSYPVTNFVKINLAQSQEQMEFELDTFLSMMTWEDYLPPEFKEQEETGRLRNDLSVQMLKRDVGLWEQNPRLPEQSYPDDAGLDLFTTETVTVHPGQFIDVPFGVAIELPVGTWGFLTGRSSTFRKMGLHVTNGIIDAGYRGPLYAGVHNPGDEVKVIPAGSRIAQFIILPNITAQFQPVRVEKLSESDRGHQGFGSTGA